jgi:hypothetical protein
MKLSDLKVMAAIGLTVLVSCSSSPQRSLTGSSVVGPKPSTATSGTLPGEPLNVAIDRILDACMDALGVTDFAVGEVEENGVKRPSRTYRDTGPESIARYEQCRQEALAAVPIPTQSKDELRETHARLLKIVDCVRNAGFDVGTMISADEYVEKGGAPDDSLTSRWKNLADDAAFVENFGRCSQLYPPPPAKS